MNTIHPTAIVHPQAKLGSEVQIGPFAVIESDVEIGDHCVIGAHSVIKQYTILGRQNIVHEHVVLGGLPQDLGFGGAVSYVRIGNENVFRECVTIHRASKEGQATEIGNNNYMMAYSHLAHDCSTEGKVIIANGAQIAGHVKIGKGAFISANVGVHQFCRIGSMAMIGGAAKVTQDCLPYIITDGNPARARGLNVVGLRRAGYTKKDITDLKNAYKILFKSDLRLDDALGRMGAIDSSLVCNLIDFMKSSERGFAHHGS